MQAHCLPAVAVGLHDMETAVLPSNEQDCMQQNSHLLQALCCMKGEGSNSDHQ